MANLTRTTLWALMLMVMVASAVSRNTPPPPPSPSTPDTTTNIKVDDKVAPVQHVVRKVQAYYTASSGPSDKGRGHNIKITSRNMTCITIYNKEDLSI
ncbi:unnamed protein product [Lactuca saligna]|uniref:Uncharacterized protein n=1 Tax=Lactuca saligna TaxID=75948 RepID=A0AA35Y9R6_LACSI|nr:unnamed protein product [Lactuca saligna]